MCRKATPKASCSDRGSVRTARSPAAIASAERHLFEVLHHLLHRSQQAAHFAVHRGGNRHGHVTACQPIGHMCRFA
jgi:hypothetical protein